MLRGAWIRANSSLLALGTAAAASTCVLLYSAPPPHASHPRAGVGAPSAAESVAARADATPTAARSSSAGDAHGASENAGTGGSTQPAPGSGGGGATGEVAAPQVSTTPTAANSASTNASSSGSSGSSGSSSAAEEVQAAFSSQPCASRVCSSAQDMFTAFSREYGHRGASTAAAGAALDGGATGAADGKPSFWFYEEEMPCPSDIGELGRATWTLLHTMAAYYPDQPTEGQQASMAAFLAALGEFYPCAECAGHLRAWLARHPPDVSGARALSRWACATHNEVNARLGKPVFDCDLVRQRWRDGPPNGSCGPAH